MEAYAFDRTALSTQVDALGGQKVLLVGDVMLDEYLEGDAERISPEAPIPVVKVERSRLLLGGAGNVARNIASLGGKAHLVGICGTDAKSNVLRSILAEDALDSSVIPLETRPTTVKTRVIARNQQMLRIDHEDTAPLAAEETARVLDAIRDVIDDFPIVVISDYGKSIINAQLMKGLFVLREASRSKPRILVDPKTPNYPLYEGVHLLTPNAKETGEAANLPVGTRDEIIAAGRAILGTLKSDHLLTTLGARGMALFKNPDEVWHIPTAAQKVFDVTGAGDTVMATLALCQSAGIDLLNSCILANYAAGIVVATVGAGTVSPEALKAVVEAAPHPEVSRWA